MNIAYQVIGDQPVDLVLSPGAWTHLELAWEVPPLARFLQRLASSYRLILFDKPGTGLSDPLPSEALPTMEERMEHVRAVMDAADSDRAVLFGTLGGGAMSGMFAASHPQRSLGLILFGTFAKLEPDTGLLTRIADSEEAALERVEREWGTEGISLAFWAPSLVADEEVKDAYLRFCRSALSPGSARRIMQLGFQVNWEAVAPSVRVPTLVLHRTGDLVVPVRQGKRLAESIPGARFVELPGVDHLVWAGDQDRVLDEVTAFVDGLRPTAGPERMLATFLFTDIEASTDIAARLGDNRWGELLEQHHRVVRQQIARFHGAEVDTAGDGFFATFDGPARGVRCALAITDEIRPLGVQVRAGVHTGECELIDGKVGGISVAIGARIMAHARGGEVMVSGTVRELVMGSGLTFDDRGVFELKGVPGRWQLYAVEDDDNAPSP